MKRIRVQSFLPVVVLAIGLMGCSSSKHQLSRMSEHHKNSGMEMMSELRQANVTLKPGKIYEVAFASVKTGQMKVLEAKYFPKAMPIVGEYGAKKIGQFQVTAKTGGEMRTPQMVLLMEWPSMTAYDRMSKDRRMKKLFPIRNRAISFFRQSFYKVKDDTNITFRSDKTYEFFAAWLNPNSGVTLKKYFEKSAAPKKRHGPPVFKANFVPAKNVPNKSFVLKPHMAGIVEWPSTENFYDLTEDEEFKKAVPLLNSAVSRLDMIHAKFVFKNK